jgi:hypothetical protein
MYLKLRQFGTSSLNVAYRYTYHTFPYRRTWQFRERKVDGRIVMIEVKKASPTSLYQAVELCLLIRLRAFNPSPFVMDLSDNLTERGECPLGI